MNTMAGIRRSGGFTLLEILIALVVIAIGLLGIAGMEALSLGNTSVARTRGLAAIISSSLTGAINANSAYWGSGAAPANFTVTASNTQPPTCTVTDATLSSNTSQTCTSSSCTPVQLAGADLGAWCPMLNQINGGKATIGCNTTGTPIICTIQISWTENNLAFRNFLGKSSTYSYQTMVQP